jgi:hypothetical protein
MDSEPSPKFQANSARFGNADDPCRSAERLVCERGEEFLECSAIAQLGDAVTD